MPHFSIAKHFQYRGQLIRIICTCHVLRTTALLLRCQNKLTPHALFRMQVNIFHTFIVINCVAKDVSQTYKIYMILHLWQWWRTLLISFCKDCQQCMYLIWTTMLVSFTLWANARLCFSREINNLKRKLLMWTYVVSEVCVYVVVNWK